MNFVAMMERYCLFVERMTSLWLEHRRALRESDPLLVSLRMQSVPQLSAMPVPMAHETGPVVDACGRDVGTFRGMYGDEAIGQ